MGRRAWGQPLRALRAGCTRETFLVLQSATSSGAVFFGRAAGTLYAPAYRVMALIRCADCGHQVSEAGVCPQCGPRLRPINADALGIGHLGWVLQALGGLVAVIGMCVFLALLAPDLSAVQTAIIWRIGSLFVFLGIVVYGLGRLGGRQWPG